MSEKELKELQERNYERIQKAKASLGSKWLLHPSNHIKRK